MLNYHKHICKHGVQGLPLANTRDKDYEKLTAITVARGLDRHSTYRHSLVISANVQIF